MIQSLGGRFPRDLSSPQKRSPKTFPYCLPEVTAVLPLGFRLFSFVFVFVFFFVGWPHMSIPEARCLLAVPPWTFTKMFSLGLNFSVPWFFCSRLFLYINMWTCGSFVLLRYGIPSNVYITIYVSIFSVDKSCFCFLFGFFWLFCWPVLLHKAAVNVLALLWTHLHGRLSGVCPTGELLTCGVCICSTLQGCAKFFSKMTMVVSTPSSDVSEFPLLSSRPKFVRLLNFCQNRRSKMVTLYS